MPKNICLLQVRWLEKERLKYWVREKIGTVTLWNFWSKDVSVSNMEEAALTENMKGKNHVERSPSYQCIKPLMPPTPAPPHPLII